MITFLNFFALVFWFFGVIAFAMSKGAPHEIEGLIMILTGFVTCCGAALLDRLDKIYKELKIMNKASAPKMEMNDLFPSQISKPAETDEAAMEKHGIKFDGKQYVFQEYGYDKLADAIAYAKKKTT